MKLSYMYCMLLGLALLGFESSVCMFRNQTVKSERKQLSDTIRKSMRDALLMERDAKKNQILLLKGHSEIPNYARFPSAGFTTETRRDLIYPWLNKEDFFGLYATSRGMRDLVRDENPQIFSPDLNLYYRLSPNVYCDHVQRRYIMSDQCKSIDQHKLLLDKQSEEKACAEQKLQPADQQPCWIM